MNKTIFSTLTNVKALGDNKFRGIASTSTKDRHGDIVVSKGAKFKLPLPLLRMHDHNNPVGSVVSAVVNDNNIEVEFELAKPTSKTLRERVSSFADEVANNLIRGLSIGFIPLKQKVIDGVLHFTEWEWTELSGVTVPANSEATIENISKSYCTAFSSNEPKNKTIKLNNKGNKMNLKEHIKNIQDKIKSLKLDLNSITKASMNESRSMTDEENEKFDDVNSEIKTLNRDLDKFQAMLDSEDQEKAAQAKSLNQSNRSNTMPHVSVVKEQLEPGQAFARLVKIKGATQAKNGFSSEEQAAAAMYGQNSQVYDIVRQKAAVPAATTSDSDWAGFLLNDGGAAADFVTFLRPRTILGRFGSDGLPSLRKVPFRTDLKTLTSGMSGYWVGEGKAKPLTQFEGDSKIIEPTKVANIAVATRELLMSSSPSADLLIRDQLVSALAARLDTDFIDPTKTAVPGVSPASITNSITPITSSGCDSDAVRCDISAAFRAFAAANNPLSSGVWIMGSAAAINLWQMKNPLGQPEYSDMRMNGGFFAGLPVIVSDYVPGDTVVLVNASDIYYADEGGVEVSVSTEASLEMADNPSHNSDTPTGSSSLVSMFQTNSVAFLAERTISWARRRASGVQVITDVDWGCCDESP